MVSRRLYSTCPEGAILPTGAVDLLINLNDEPLRLFDGNCILDFDGAFVCGPHAEFFTIDPTRPQVVIGAHFKPGCAFLFLKPIRKMKGAVEQGER
jgi:hypothetical protein